VPHQSTTTGSHAKRPRIVDFAPKQRGGHNQVGRALQPPADTMATQYPETRVLIIMTGGTICMRPSADGLVPARGFLEEGMAPRPSFNDGSKPGELQVCCAVRCFESRQVFRGDHLDMEATEDISRDGREAGGSKVLDLVTLAQVNLSGLHTSCQNREHKRLSCLSLLMSHTLHLRFHLCTFSSHT